MAVQEVVIPAYAPYRLRSRLFPVLRPFAALGLLGSVLSVAAYALVLWARAPVPIPCQILRPAGARAAH